MMTPRTISWEELITETDRILGEAQHGASFVIAANGVPVATLESFAAEQPPDVPDGLTEPIE